MQFTAQHANAAALDLIRRHGPAVVEHPDFGVAAILEGAKLAARNVRGVSDSELALQTAQLEGYDGLAEMGGLFKKIGKALKKGVKKVGKVVKKVGKVALKVAPAAAAGIFAGPAAGVSVFSAQQGVKAAGKQLEAARAVAAGKTPPIISPESGGPQPVIAVQDAAGNVSYVPAAAGGSASGSLTTGTVAVTPTAAGMVGGVPTWMLAASAAAALLFSLRQARESPRHRRKR